MASDRRNYAANNPTTNWGNASDPYVAIYRNQILNDALPSTAAAQPGQPACRSPTFTAGGNGPRRCRSSATVSITCTFRSSRRSSRGSSALAGNLPVSASAEFPVKAGLIGQGRDHRAAPSRVHGAPGRARHSPSSSPTSPPEARRAWSWDFDSDPASTPPTGPNATYSGAWALHGDAGRDELRRLRHGGPKQLHPVGMPSRGCQLHARTEARSRVLLRTSGSRRPRRTARFREWDFDTRQLRVTDAGTRRPHPRHHRHYSVA